MVTSRELSAQIKSLKKQLNFLTKKLVELDKGKLFKKEINDLQKFLSDEGIEKQKSIEKSPKKVKKEPTLSPKEDLSRKEKIQLPNELKHLKSEIIEVLGSDIEIEISDLHHKPIGAPGIGLFIGFFISLFAGEAVVGFLKGLGIDCEAPFEFIGRKIKKIPSNVKKLFKWHKSSVKVFNNKPPGYLKIFVYINKITLCFHFGKIERIEDFYFALANIQVFLTQFANILSSEFIKRGETIVLVWEEDKWKIDSFLSSVL